MVGLAKNGLARSLNSNGLAYAGEGRELVFDLMLPVGDVGHSKEHSCRVCR